MAEMRHKTMTCLRMYYNSFPVVLSINHSFSNFEETLTHLNHHHMNYIYILYYYYYYYYITIIMVRDGRVKEHLFKQNFTHRTKNSNF